jgi:hypothetical protein
VEGCPGWPGGDDVDVGGVVDGGGWGGGENVESVGVGDAVGEDDLAGVEDLAGGEDLGGTAEWVVTATVGASAGVGSGAADGELGVMDGITAGAEDVTAVLMAPASALWCGAPFAWPPPDSRA